MSRKRRMFDINMPASEAEQPKAEAAKTSRRAPMAAAIGDTADALRIRSRLEAEARAENDALAHEFVRLKKLGLIVDLVPLDQITHRKLVRDRRVTSDLSLDDLKGSLQEIGLSNPIRVEAVGDGQYELVQGMRRLTAYRELLAETGDERWGSIPAGILPSGESDAALYRRMVDENLVRKGVSFAEMAQLARSYADDQVDGCASLDDAVNHLYAATSPQKRSYIRRFAQLMMMLDKVLERPEDIPRALGLAVLDRIEADSAASSNLVARLRGRSAIEQVRAMRDFVTQQPGPTKAKTRGAPKRSQGRVALTVPVGGGVRCTAADGKMELRAKRDFSTVERHKLEAAIAAFFAELERD